MYVLLNLKDGTRLNDVVQLLFAHGHTAVSVADSIEDLCPRCECSMRQAEVTGNANIPLTDSPAPSTSFTPESKVQPFITATPTHEEIDLTHDTDAVTNGSATPSEGTPVGQQQAVERRSLRSRRKTSTKATPPPSKPTDVKEEALEETSSRSKENMDESAQFNITSALELLCSASTSTVNPDDLEIEIDTDRNVPLPSKRKARIEQLGLETFQCQLCNKAITRQGQYANLVNHLSRHSRLHASKKQYCCPVCRGSFSRRYLAYAHVREAHPKHGYVEPLDHGRELREEYRALLEVCFPGASSRRKTAPRPRASDEKRSDPGKSDSVPPDVGPMQSDELTRLLQQ